MIQFVLSDPQRCQLQILEALGAVSPDRARSATKDNGLNGVMLGVALFPKGLVGKEVRRAQYGEPQRTVYWITAAGRVARSQPPLARELRGMGGAVMIDELAYDAAADAAEQIP